MKPILFVVNTIVIASLVVLTLRWPPAGLTFLLVGPLAVLGIRTVTTGDVAARGLFVTSACVTIVALVSLSMFWPFAAYGFIFVGPIVVLGIVDMLQTEQAVRRNFPVIGHFRYLLEAIRPEIQQYFIETNIDGRPFNREERSIVYQRAKGELDTLPFGTQRDVYETGYEWINHSLAPLHAVPHPPKVRFGADTCERPYDVSLLNVSAMSFGSLSPNAIEALNRAAKRGGFAHNTGEGGISPYHLHGGDLVWQIGTAYFDCRTADGRFDRDRFVERAAIESVRMIELKLSQGAKPGHGGILPAAKITPQIAEIRGVPMGEDVISPPAHSAFATPIELVRFLTELRDLSGGKPVGFKLCVGKRREFLAVCKAMVETGMHPDFITVDGGEGGTGAAPPEFSNRLGCPLTEGLAFVHNALVGAGLRERVRVIASGKVSSGFGLTRSIAVGADVCNSARSMMMALGCIQARRCNSNECPVGVATQNPALTVGLVVEDKAERVARYQRDTVEAALELMAAAGLARPEDLRPWHIVRRISPTEVRHLGEIFESLEPGSLLGDDIPGSYVRAWSAARADSFQHAPN